MAETIGSERRIINRRGKIGEILDYVSKFALESTVVQSLRISTGTKQEVSKDEPSPVPLNGQNEAHRLNLVAEEMQAKIEKMQEDMDIMRQHRKISAKCAEKLEAPKGLCAKIEKMQEEMSDVTLQCKTEVKCIEQLRSSKKKPEEPKGSEIVQKERRSVFIRSRL